MQSATRRLENLINNEKTGHLTFSNYSLKDIKYLLKYYGEPHKKFKSIHIAGTNGKGSVAHMLNSMLITGGYKTGLYTSPHLVKINERIKINNRQISDSVLNKYTDELVALLNKNEKLRPTYFDALTLFAFRYFCDTKTEIAIIEVGLGGRLDSTNVITPEVSVITDISIDHKNVLGHTKKEIAAEKAGIIKPRRPVITSNRDRDVLDVIKKKAVTSSSELYILNKDFKIKSSDTNGKQAESFSLLLPQKIYPAKKIENIKLNLAGEFQKRNASLAITAALILNRNSLKIDEKTIRLGLKRVRIQGRLHIISKDPLIIFDPAHNIHALKETVNALKKNYPKNEFKIVLSIMTDKDYNKMFRIISEELCGEIYYFELDDERCLKPSAAKTGKGKLLYKNVKTFDKADDIYHSMKKNLKPNSIIFVTGSFRLYSLAKKLARMFKKGR